MSIKCPNCSTNNGVTNKFCRECGLKLESAEQIVEEQAAPAQTAAVQPHDEVNLGEELFSIMRLYDNGDLESAEERVCRIIESNPSSASAHSIRALIYERKGDNESANGNEDIAQDYLEKAIKDYEAIMALNPHSAADRGKLSILKLKLAGKKGESAVPDDIVNAGGTKNKFLELASRVPAPILAAVCAFIVLLVFCSMLIPRGGSRAPRIAENSVDQTPMGKTQVTTTPNPGPPEENAYNVYTYPSPPQTPALPNAPSTPAPTLPQVIKTSAPAAQKVKLPPAGSELVLVSEEKKPAPPKPSRLDMSVKPKPTPTGTASPSQDRDAPEGSALLSRAIELKNQGKYADAIDTARQSIQSYQSDLDGGRNVTEARRGIDNAYRCIRFCQMSLNE